MVVPGDVWQLEAHQRDGVLPQFTALMQRLAAAVDHVIAVNGNTDTVADLRLITSGTDVIVLDDEVTQSRSMTPGSGSVASRCPGTTPGGRR